MNTQFKKMLSLVLAVVMLCGVNVANIFASEGKPAVMGKYVFGRNATGNLAVTATPSTVGNIQFNISTDSLGGIEENCAYFCDSDTIAIALAERTKIKVEISNTIGLCVNKIETESPTVEETETTTEAEVCFPIELSNSSPTCTLDPGLYEITGSDILPTCLKSMTLGRPAPTYNMATLYLKEDVYNKDVLSAYGVTENCSAIRFVGKLEGINASNASAIDKIGVAIIDPAYSTIDIEEWKKDPDLDADGIQNWYTERLYTDVYDIKEFDRNAYENGKYTGASLNLPKDSSYFDFLVYGSPESFSGVTLCTYIIADGEPIFMNIDERCNVYTLGSLTQ